MEMFRDARQVKKKLKMLVFGESGVGKTHFALTAPKCAVIDMEHSTDHFTDGRVAPFKVLHTRSAAEALAAVEFLANYDGDDIETVVIDPVSVYWDSLQEAFLERMQKDKPWKEEMKFEDWKKIKTPYNRAMLKLVSLPFHFILVARASTDYQLITRADGKLDDIVVKGIKPQAEKNTDYNVDVILRLEWHDGKRSAYVVKDRVGNRTGQRLIEPVFADILTPAVKEQTAALNIEDTTRKDASLFEPPPFIPKPTEASPEQFALVHTLWDKCNAWSEKNIEASFTGLSKSAVSDKIDTLEKALHRLIKERVERWIGQMPLHILEERVVALFPPEDILPRDDKGNINWVHLKSTTVKMIIETLEAVNV